MWNRSVRISRDSREDASLNSFFVHPGDVVGGGLFVVGFSSGRLNHVETRSARVRLASVDALPYSPTGQVVYIASHCNQMDVILSGLNAAQSAAVTSAAPVLQVLAPPGSGKTKTLTARVAYLLAHHGYRPWNVICCTFTIKASREMRARLKDLIGEALESKLLLGTFHSICRRYLANYGYLIGIARDFGIADASDSLAIITVCNVLFDLYEPY